MDMRHIVPTWRPGLGGTAAIAEPAPAFWRETDDADAPPLTFASISLFLRRNLVRILVTGLAIAAALFILSILLLNKFAATATIVIDPRAPNITQGASVLPNIGPDANAIESIVQATKSHAFLGALVDKLGLAQGTTPAARDLAIDKLAAQLNISRHGTTYVIDATVSNPSPVEAARIANAAAQAIIDNQQAVRVGADDQIATEITSRLADAKAKVDQAEQAAAALKADLKVTDVGQGTTLLERRVYELNQQLVLAVARTASARARLAQLLSPNSSAAADLAPASELTVLNNLRADYARLQRQAADQAVVLGPRHPALASLNAEIADTKRQISAELTRRVAATRADLAQSQQQEDLLSHQLKAAQQESGDLGGKLVKLGALTQEARAERSVYDQLLVRQKQLSETKNLTPSDIRFVSRATPPEKRKPGLALRALGSLALGLFCGFGYAFGRERIAAPLITSQQVARATGFDVIGWAPQLVGRSGGRAKSNGSSKPSKTKGRAKKRTPVRHDSPQQPDLTPWIGELCGLFALNPSRTTAPVMLVASPAAGAGRTMLATSCARYFTEGGASVLLIEASARSGAKKQEPFGLIDVLNGDEAPQDIFVEDTGEGYTLLPYGGRFAEDGPNANALMGGATLETLLTLCRQWFDIVIIDGPAALEASYAPQLARHADLTVLIAEWNRTTPAEATESILRLDADDLVVFFNKVDTAQLRLFDPAQSRWITAMADA